jgi:outer membrane protein
MKSFIFIYLLLLTNTALCQKKWDLKTCIDFALSHKIEILQQTENTQLSEKQLQYSKLRILPSFNIAASQNFKSYKTFNQSTNKWENINPSLTEIDVYTKIGIFNAFYNQYNIQMYKYLKIKSINNLEQIKNEIRLSVLSAYTNCLYYKENYQISISQKQLLIEQKNNYVVLVQKGEKSELDLLELEAKILNENTKVTEAQKELEESLIDLKKSMQLPDSSSFSVNDFSVPSEIQYSIPSGDSIYNIAINQLPDIEFYNAEINASNCLIKSVRSNYYPNLYLTGTLSSTSNSLSTNLANPQSHYGLSKQFKDNYISIIGLQLNIPVYSKHEIKQKVIEEKYNLNNLQFEKQKKLDEIYFDIQKLQNNIQANIKNFEIIKDVVNSYTDIYDLTEKKYNHGVITFLEYITAKKNLEESEIELIKTKYNLLYSLKLIDYYLGKPLTI